MNKQTCYYCFISLILGSCLLRSFPIACRKETVSFLPSATDRSRSSRQPRLFLVVCLLSERLSIAYITNPWAPVNEFTGPHRVTINNIKNLGRALKCFNMRDQKLDGQIWEVAEAAAMQGRSDATVTNRAAMPPNRSRTSRRHALAV